MSATSRKSRIAGKIPHPVSGLTSVQEIQKIKASLRHMWRKSSRANHIRSVRFPHPDKTSKFQYAVRCVKCDAVFGQSQKVPYRAKSGRRKRTGAYHVDHICEEGLPAVKDLVKDLGKHADKLIHTPCRILCVPCHELETRGQMKRRHKK